MNDITQKTILRLLTRCANRSSSPATEKQCSFLSSLIFKAGKDADDIGCGVLDSNSTLSVKFASEWISFYLNA